MLHPLIEFRNADLGYGRRSVLERIDFSIYAGDFLGIVGPNGAGKTTILKSILGLLKPVRGEVVFREGNLRIGYVPQRETLDSAFPLSMLDIVLMGRYPRIGLIRRPGKEDYEKANECLAHVGISNLAHRPYRNLSGGQKQRALIARALAGEPSLLVLDEPTNGMDLASEEAIMSLIERLHTEDASLTILMVSHLLNTVANYAHRLVILGDGDLRIGPVEEVLTSQNITNLYGMPVQVALVNGRRVVLAGGAHSVAEMETRNEV
ncbi:MAG: metal ABC transporter ATP-binding protein [Armatimonadetes bacterium]|nr:metal ABC transporter ATP-binding protein [Armatimonadota bacterium]